MGLGGIWRRIHLDTLLEREEGRDRGRGGRKGGEREGGKETQTVMLTLVDVQVTYINQVSPEVHPKKVQVISSITEPHQDLSKHFKEKFKEGSDNDGCDYRAPQLVSLTTPTHTHTHTHTHTYLSYPFYYLC